MSEREDDADLLARLAEGEREVLAELYDRHSGLLYTMALRIVGEPADAQDLLQDVFAGLERRAAQFRREEGRAVGWLLTVTRRLALDRVRQAKRRRELLWEKAGDVPGTHGAGAAAPNFYGDEVMRLRECVGQLDDQQRTALEMAYFGGLTHEEISRSLEAPLGTIKARIRRGLLRLKTCVEEDAR